MAPRQIVGRHMGHGGFLPNNHGFPTRNDHFGVFWGYHHLRKHPYVYIALLQTISWGGFREARAASLPNEKRNWPNVLKQGILLSIAAFWFP